MAKKKTNPAIISAALDKLRQELRQEGGRSVLYMTDVKPDRLAELMDEAIDAEERAVALEYYASLGRASATLLRSAVNAYLGHTHDDFSVTPRSLLAFMEVCGLYDIGKYISSSEYDTPEARARELGRILLFVPARINNEEKSRYFLYVRGGETYKRDDLVSIIHENTIFDVNHAGSTPSTAH